MSNFSSLLIPTLDPKTPMPRCSATSGDAERMVHFVLFPCLLCFFSRETSVHFFVGFGKVFFLIGVNIINLGKTWEKIVLAARIIVALENPEDLVVVSARQFGQRAVFKFAQNTGAQYIGGRYTPGTFTNQIQKQFLEPRVLLVTDPTTDAQVFFLLTFFIVCFFRVLFFVVCCSKRKKEEEASLQRGR